VSAEFRSLVEMNMKPTIEQFEEVASYCEGVRFYGSYQGRFFYKGIGLVAGSESDAASFLVEMRGHGYKIPAWDHSDSMGLGVVVAWREDVFAGNEKPSRADKHQWRTLGVQG
jgi:hypothetical protein